jgi:hypothetical protein
MQETLDELVSIEENGLPPLTEIEEDMPLDEFDKAWIAEVFGNSKENTAPVPSVPPHQKHGNTAQIATLIVAALALILGPGTAIYFHNSDASKAAKEVASTAADAHTNDLIEKKLTPAIGGVNENINAKIGELNKTIGGLSDKVANLYGLTGKVASLEAKTDRQTSLARLMDPNRTLGMVRAEIQLAQANGKPLSPATLVDYKNAVLELPSSSYQYWTTVAAIINYQSKMNQMSGEAPDPSKVSRPCVGFTNNEHMHASGNLVAHQIVKNCIADLETGAFQDVTFVNSVIRYNGGTTSLTNVTFVNCNFIINLAVTPKPDKYPLLVALLNSPTQSSVKVP